MDALSKPLLKLSQVLVETLLQNFLREWRDMPSYLPILSYSSSVPDEENAKLSLDEGRTPDAEGTKISSFSTESKLDVRPGKSINNSNVSQPQGAAGPRRDGKKLVRRRREPREATELAAKRDGSAPKDMRFKGKLDKEKIEKLVRKAKSHAQAVQAVKRAVYDVQLQLLDGPISFAQLECSARLLTQGEFQDVVVERSIAGKCGYALCCKELTESHHKGRFRISVTEQKIIDTRETALYCSDVCLVASKGFSSRLQVRREGVVGWEKLAAIVRSVRNVKASDIRPSGSDVADLGCSDTSADSVLCSVTERQNVERGRTLEAGPSDAIEGYVPIRSVRERSSRDDALQPSSASVSSIVAGCKSASPDAQDLTANGEVSSARFSTEWSSGQGNLVAESATAGVVGSPPGIPRLKSILKNTSSPGKTIKRSVSWKDEKVDRERGQKAEHRLRDKMVSKPRRQVKEMPQSVARSVASMNENDGSSQLGPKTLLRCDVAARSPVKGYVEGVMLEDTEKLPLSKEFMGLGREQLVPTYSRVAEAGPSDQESAKKLVADVNNLISPEAHVSTGTPVDDLQFQLSARLASAESVAAAITEAAEAMSILNVESSEAVSMVGLSILPPHSEPGSEFEKLFGQPLSEAGKLAREVVKWPMAEECEDFDDSTNPKSGWQDTAPKNFKLEMSTFGTIWTALEQWVSAATIAFIYGKDAEREGDYLSVDGREYQRQAGNGIGVSADVSRAFSSCIARTLPDVVHALGLRVPVSCLENLLGRMVRTMSFVQALPAFGVNQWRMIVMLLLESLSVVQYSAIGLHLSKNSSSFEKFLLSTGVSQAEYKTFKGLLLPYGLPDVTR